MTFTRRTATLALGAAALTPAAAHAQPVTFPIILHRERYWADVLIDGHPLRLLIDTGSNGFLINSAIAARLKLTPLRNAGGVEGVTGPSAFLANRMVVGGAFALTATTLYALNPNSFPADPADGVLPVFSLFTTQFDFRRRRAVIVRNRAELPGDYTVIRCERNYIGRQADPRFFVQATVDGHPCRLLVDTGAGGMVVLYRGFVRRRRLWSAYPKAVADSVTTIRGKSLSRMVRAGRVAFGDVAVDKPVIVLSDPEDAATDGMSADGVIGAELLRRFEVFFDGPRMELGFRANADLHAPVRYPRGGVDFEWKEGAVRIVNIDADGPAAKAGLRVGDVVKGYSGEPGVTDLDIRFYDPAGTAVSLDVERAGAVQAVKVVLEELL